MVLDMAINFCILFTFSALIFLPFHSKFTYTIPFKKLHPLFIGIASGIAGLVLMQTAVEFPNNTFVDARTAVITISGIYGGAVSPLVSALIIGVARIFYEGISSTSLIAGGNTIVVGIAIFFVMRKIPMTFKSARYFFHYYIIQTGIVFFYLLGRGTDAILPTVYLFAFSYLSFFTLLFILQTFDAHFKSIDAVERLSETDFLTGLYNNRKFQLEAAKVLADRKVFSLILLDIDRFKKVNDTYGHPIGDEVLQELAARLRRIAGPAGGIFSRNGGEEFSVILPASNSERAKEVAETLRTAIASSPFPTTTDLELSITISLGIATFPENGKDIQQLYNQADLAMYEAKETGRNKAVHINETAKKAGTTP